MIESNFKQFEKKPTRCFQIRKVGFLRGFIKKNMTVFDKVLTEKETVKITLLNGCHAMV
jgi:hypothetical protein